MIFADLATEDSVFVDSNMLIYHFNPHLIFESVCPFFWLDYQQTGRDNKS